MLDNILAYVNALIKFINKLAALLGLDIELSEVAF